MFRFGNLCDQLISLLRPMDERSYGRRLIRDIEGHKKAMNKMDEDLRHEVRAHPAPFQDKILAIVGRYISPLNKMFVEIIAEDLWEVSKIITTQIVYQSKLDHYLDSVNDPPVNPELRMECTYALLILACDKATIEEAKRKLKPYEGILRLKRNPDFMKAAVELVRLFRMRGGSKAESIQGAYEILKFWAPESMSPSLHGFQVRIHKYLSSSS